MHRFVVHAAVLGFGAISGMSTAFATSIELEAGLDDVASAHLTVLADGKPVCELSKPADDKTTTSATCCFQFNSRITAWQVTGSYRLPGLPGRTLKGEKTIKVLDFGVATKFLTPSEQPYGERMASFVEATNRFVHQHMPDYVGLIDTHDAATAAALDAAAKRVGFALPPEFVSMQRRVGALGMNDHSMMKAEDLADAYTQMVHVWGTPEDAMQSEYSKPFQTMLRNSTLLFTEVGDGYGGLLYHPGKTKSCGDAGAYYWTSQEGGTSVAKHEDGRCMDFAAAMRWVFNYFVVDDVAEKISEEVPDAVLVDSNMQRLPVELSIQTGDYFGMTLRARWPGPYR